VKRSETDRPDLIAWRHRATDFRHRPAQILFTGRGPVLVNRRRPSFLFPPDGHCDYLIPAAVDFADSQIRFAPVSAGTEDGSSDDDRHGS